MAGGNEIAFTLFEGPNLTVPFAAVIAEFENPIPGILPASEIRRLAANLLPEAPQLTIEPPKENTDLPSLAAAFTREWQLQIWRYTPELEMTATGNGRFRLVSSFYDADATKNLLQAAVRFANVLFSCATGAEQVRDAAAIVEKIFALLRDRPLSIATATLIRLAAKREIQAYPVINRAYCLFGQGAKGVYFSNMSNQEDSHIGWTISGNKALTVRLLRQMGLPTTEQEVAADPASARRVAVRLGFPLVVKPADRGMGLGVAVDLTNEAELAAAYERARAAARNGQVLIERFVEGEDHRLTVFAGRLMRVTRLLPPRITGDGKRTVAELIAEKNREVPSNAAALGFFSGHKIDAEMAAILRKQGFGPEDRPPAGKMVQLRNTSNLHTGGSSEDVTAQIHPDNAAMAETIAKTLHLDAAGIDFITLDIARPWHETECAIIEVNSNPGVRDEATLERMLAAKFPGGDGRVPSVLIAGGGEEIARVVTARFAAASVRVGYTDAKETSLAGQPRFTKGAKLPARWKGLIMDATCEALVISCTSQDIAMHGLPNMRFDLAVLGGAEGLSSEIRRLIESSAARVTDGREKVSLDKALAPLLSPPDPD